MNTDPIKIDYSDAKLRTLVEEYITMQRREFTFRGVCDSVLYRAMEEGHTAGQTIYDSNEFQLSDQDRIRCVLTKIVEEGRITVSADKVTYMKVKE